MKHVIHVNSNQSHSKVHGLIDTLFNDQKEFIVTITPPSKDISPQQRGLYWEWMTIIGKEIGDDKEYYHAEFKKMFLVNIYRRDNEEYSKMVDAWIAIKANSDSRHATIVGQWILNNTSITKANTRQMTEYMESIKKYCATHLAIELPYMGLLND